MNNLEPVELTIDYIDSHKTKAGAWTRKQIEALGLKWPLVTGWKDRLVGEIITAEQANIFETENVRKVKGKPNKSHQLTIDKCIEYLFKNVNKLTHHQLVRLRNVESKYLDARKLNKRK